MEVTKVRYELLVNLQNDENEKLYIEADLEDGDSVPEVLERCRTLAYESAQTPVEHEALLRARRRARLDKLAEPSKEPQAQPFRGLAPTDDLPF